MSSTTGFTLIEVLIVVALIGILAAIAAPGWVTFANRQRANRASDQILQALRQAQNDARRIKQDKTVTFFTDPAADPDPNTDVPSIGYNGVVSELGEGDLKDGMIQLQVTDSAGDDVTDFVFDPTGGLDVNQAPDLPVRIVVSAPADSGTKRCVIVETLLVATRTARDTDCDAP